MKILFLTNEFDSSFFHLNLKNSDDLQFYHDDIYTPNLINTINQINPIMTFANLVDFQGNEFTFICNFHQTFPEIKLIVIVNHIELDHIRRLYKAGIYDFIESTELSCQLIFGFCDEMRQISLPKLNLSGTSLLDSDNASPEEQQLYQMATSSNREQELLMCWEGSAAFWAQYKKYALLLVETNRNIYQTTLDELLAMKAGIESCLTMPFYGFCAIYNNRSFLCIISTKNLCSEDTFLKSIFSIGQDMVSLFSKSFHAVATIGISNIGYDLKDIHKAFKQCQSALFNETYYGIGHVYYYSFRNSSADESAPYYLLNQFEDILNAPVFHLDQALSAISDFFTGLRLLRPSGERLQAELLHFLSLLYAFCSKNSITYRNICGFGYLGTDILKAYRTLDSVQHFFEYCLTQLDREITQKQNRASAPCCKTTSDALKFVNENYAKEITLEDIAGFLEVSPSYLSKIFKKDTGMNLTQYVNSLRIQHAKRLLETTNKRVYEIAQETGFQSTAYFCRIFKKLEHVTCAEYQTSRLNKKL